MRTSDCRNTFFGIEKSNMEKIVFIPLISDLCTGQQMKLAVKTFDP